MLAIATGQYMIKSTVKETDDIITLQVYMIDRVL